MLLNGVVDKLGCFLVFEILFLHANALKHCLPFLGDILRREALFRIKAHVTGVFEVVRSADAAGFRRCLLHGTHGWNFADYGIEELLGVVNIRKHEASHVARDLQCVEVVSGLVVGHAFIQLLTKLDGLGFDIDDLDMPWLGRRLGRPVNADHHCTPNLRIYPLLGPWVGQVELGYAKGDWRLEVTQSLPYFGLLIPG